VTLTPLLSVRAAEAPPATPDFVDENMITHGPILGRLSSSGVGVWARTLRPGPFTVLYGTAPDQLDQTAGPVVTTLEHDNTGWVHITGLKPDTRYWYELKNPDSTGRTGRGGFFRTLPDPESVRDPELNPRGLFNFSFEFACGNNQNPRHSLGPALPTFTTMLREIVDEVHFAILNGDWLYEVRRDYTPQQWAAHHNVPAAQMPRVLDIAPTLAGVWENYKFFLDQGEPLAHWHRQVPSFFTYDDHECLNDIWGAGTPGLRDRRAVFRDIGVQAWYDYLGWANPTPFTSPIHFGRGTFTAGSDVLVDEQADFTQLRLADHNNLHVHWGTPTAGVNDNALDDRDDGVPNAGVYRIEEVLGPHRLRIWPAAKADGQASYSIGRRSYFHMRVGNCDFFVLDTRGQREMHDTRNPFKKVSMLGPEQRDWLLEGIRRSDADFIFVVSSVNFMVPHVGGGAIRGDNKDDAWTVFFDERERLIEAFDALPQPVFVLTGDLHNSFAIQITDNVYEFASGPHNSNNHWVRDEGDRPPNGKFQYGPREVDILWSTYFRADIDRTQLLHPSYCVVQVNNVFNNPLVYGQPSGNTPPRWVAFPRPQVIFRYYDGRTGRLRFAHAIRAAERVGK
jgi:phosphodiesterase/alkaline phosphatase D-like protein